MLFIFIFNVFHIFNIFSTLFFLFLFITDALYSKANYERSRYLFSTEKNQANSVTADRLERNAEQFINVISIPVAPKIIWIIIDVLRAWVVGIGLNSYHSDDNVCTRIQTIRPTIGELKGNCECRGYVYLCAFPCQSTAAFILLVFFSLILLLCSSPSARILSMILFLSSSERKHLNAI